MDKSIFITRNNYIYHKITIYTIWKYHMAFRTAWVYFDSQEIRAMWYARCTDIVPCPSTNSGASATIEAFRDLSNAITLVLGTCKIWMPMRFEIIIGILISVSSATKFQPTNFCISFPMGKSSKCSVFYWELWRF